MIATAKRLESVQEYYFSRKLREVSQMIQQGHPVINMGIGSPDLAPHPESSQCLVHSNGTSQSEHVSKLSRASRITLSDC